ncbi:hypothetical protein REPUB_Repub16aG0144500 [Reevesia pubescens]
MSLFPLLAFASNETGKTLVIKTCNLTNFPTDCISALESNPQSFNANNLTSLSRIALQVTASKIKDTASFVQYCADHAADNTTRKYAFNCYYIYKRCIGSMDDSLGFFDDIVYDESYLSVQAVNDAVTECKNLGVQVLNDVNTKMFRLTWDVMTILHLLF